MFPVKRRRVRLLVCLLVTFIVPALGLRPAAKKTLDSLRVIEADSEVERSPALVVSYTRVSSSLQQHGQTVRMVLVRHSTGQVEASQSTSLTGIQLGPSLNEQFEEVKISEF